MGHLVLTVLGMVAQMERRFIKERQREGIAWAKGEGAYRGGTRRLDRDSIKALHAAGSGPAIIAREVGCSRMQVYRVLQEVYYQIRETTSDPPLVRTSSIQSRGSRMTRMG